MGKLLPDELVWFLFKKNKMPFFNSKTDKLRFALLTANGLTNLRLNKIASEYEDFFDGFEDNFAKIGDEKFTKKVDKFKKTADKEIVKLYELLIDKKIRFITAFDKQYPSILRSLNQPPMVLFFEGNSSLFAKLDNMITVVGSRDVTKYTIESMQKILSPVCNSGVGVVSGLANGVDSMAHQIALENSAPTIAVLGNGILDEKISPREHLQLKNRIIENDGLVVSELLPDMDATKFSFPRRNRILAAMGKMTVVFQAGEKSGSMITADYAKEMDKKLATIPVYLGENVYQGNVELLSKGAKCVTKGEDIAEMMGVKLSKNKVKNIYKNLSEIEISLVDSLRGGEKSVDELAAVIPFSKLMIMLSNLEMQGLVKNSGSNKWRLT